MQCLEDVLEYEESFKSASEIQEVGSIVSRIVPLVPVYVDEPHIWKLIFRDTTRLNVSASSFLLATFFSPSFRIHKDWM